MTRCLRITSVIRKYPEIVTDCSNGSRHEPLGPQGTNVGFTIISTGKEVHKVPDCCLGRNEARYATHSVGIPRDALRHECFEPISVVSPGEIRPSRQEGQCDCCVTA